MPSFCSRPARVAASRGPRSVASVEWLLGFWLAVSLLALATPTEAQTISGRVIDGVTEAPVAYAQIWLQSVDEITLRLTMTDSLGEFELQVDSAGTYRLESRRAGYHGESGDPFEVGPDGRGGIEIRLSPEPITLEGIEVVARPSVPLIHQDSHEGLYARRNSTRFGSRAGPARVMVRSDLARMDEMAMWRFVEVHGPHRRCPLEATVFYVDGWEVQRFTEGDTDENTGWPWNAQPHSAVRDWEAVEIYARTSEAPIGLRPVDPFACSVIALWRHHDPDWN